MPDGEMRRPPQLWEERLARTTSLLSVGLTPGDATAVVSPTPVPGSDGGVEPSPVLPPPGSFIKPSTPTLTGGIQGINVTWDGLNADGDLWPYDTSFVEVHVATSGTGFTPSSATLRGRLARPGSLFVGGLTAGTTYYARLRGADPAGNVTDPSDAATGSPSLTTANDYGTATIGSGAVSFDARAIGGVTNTVGSVAPSNPRQNDVWLDNSPGTAIIHKIYNGSTWVTNAWGSASIAAGQITALQLAAGAVTAGAIAAGAVTTDKLTAGTITGFRINGGTISGSTIQTGGISNQILIRDSALPGNIDVIEFKAGGSNVGYFYGDITGLICDSQLTIFEDLSVSGTAYCDKDLYVEDACFLGFSGAERAVRIGSDGKVFSYGVDDNTTANAANVRVGASAQLLRSTSTVRLKDTLIPLDDDLVGVEPEKLADFPASVDPYDVLTITPTEFRSLSEADTQARILGFIAEDVAEKLPWAVTWDLEGLPAAVEDRPILAALLHVVKEQQATITDLRARIEALEA